MAQTDRAGRGWRFPFPAQLQPVMVVFTSCPHAITASSAGSCFEQHLTVSFDRSWAPRSSVLLICFFLHIIQLPALSARTCAPSILILPPSQVDMINVSLLARLFLFRFSLQSSIFKVSAIPPPGCPDLRIAAQSPCVWMNTSCYSIPSTQIAADPIPKLRSFCTVNHLFCGPPGLDVSPHPRFYQCAVQSPFPLSANVAFSLKPNVANRRSGPSLFR